MRAEALDIVIESRAGSVWLILSGPFHGEQAPNIREKITSLVQDANRDIVVHMQDVTFVDPSVPEMFLILLNGIRGKGGNLRFVFRNDQVSKAFAPYRNLFSIYPDAEALNAGGLMGTLRRQTQILFRRTGIRISRPVAIFLAVVLGLWFLSLGFIIRIQSRTIREQAVEIQKLTRWKQEAQVEIEELSERLKPMEQLGLLPQTDKDKHE